MKLALGLASLIGIAHAQNACLSPSAGIRPSVASGYALQVVATGLSRPRGLSFDSQGHLLVVEAGSGILSSHVVNNSGNCTRLQNSTTVIQGEELNHGLWVNDTTLFASNAESVFSWNYDAAARTISNQQELVIGMNNSINHRTRTLLLPQSAPGTIVVTRGSNGNLDLAAAAIEGGTAQVRAFNLNERVPGQVYNWTEGEVVGWGTRNQVGIAEHPTTNGIWGVENSADNINRSGVLVKRDNPGEELVFFGYLNGTQSPNFGSNFGYPFCLAAYNTSDLPNNQSLQVGSQFAFDQEVSLNNENRTDAFCAQTTPPRLVFQAHMSPIDIKFNNSGTQAFISFRGSWNREDPVGYALALVEFGANGEPTAPSTSQTAATFIVRNEDTSRCPDDCFRPTGLAIDAQGRIFMASDASGEIYLITRDVNARGTTGQPGSTSPESTPTGSGAAATSSTPASAASVHGVFVSWLVGALATCMYMLF